MESQIAKLPAKPGVYFFLDKRGRPLYIGRATNLKNRVKSYFSSNLMATRGPLIAGLLSKAKNLKWVETNSVLEAIILEANLIKKYQPFYNTKEKDKKSFNYIVITKEKFPRVLIVRGRNLGKKESYKNIFGPFPKGDLLKEALRIIRKIFPFRDKCEPSQNRPCFDRQLGLCPGVCTGEITEEKYRRNIAHLTLFLKGQTRQLIKKLEKEMKNLAKKEKFEEATELKKQIFALKHIQDVALIKKEFKEVKEFRLEAYDVAHFGGEAKVGAMVVWQDGEMKKSDYRKFKLKPGSDDLKGLQEILKRRLNHLEWPLPNLIALDGGQSQLNAALEVLEEKNIKIPLVSVIKNEYHRPKQILGNKVFAKKYESAILLANAEAHRFAESYHRKLRQKIFQGKIKK